MLTSDRTRLRRVFLDAWRKARQGLPLEPLERLVAQVIGEHPEYQSLLEQGDAGLDQDFTPEGGQTNPFLHLGMHISLQEQLLADRPDGIRDLYQQLARRRGDAHQAEHELMECLGLALWEAQRAGRLPDEQAYLNYVRALLKT